MGAPIQYLSRQLFEKQDPAGLGIARFLYGLLMIIDIFEERGLAGVSMRFGDQDSCYFPLFNNLPRFSVEAMFLVYLVLLIAATGIMLGFFYRWSCFWFMVCYWYLFFLDKTVWNNHSYLYGLMSVLFFVTDAHHYWSIDGFLWPSIRNTHVPKWNYTIIRFQLFILYFLAGLKKIDFDWVAGYSMRGLASKWVFDPFRMFMTNEQINFFIVHLGGLAIDLSMGFLLTHDKTRILGYLIAYSFHTMNALLFNIGMFSYACMGLIPIFAATDWPKKLISKLPSVVQSFSASTSPAQENPKCLNCDDKDSKKTEFGSTWTFRRILVCFGIFGYTLFQLTLPFSHSITRGYNSWTQGLYGYSWDMMVHSWHSQHVVIKVVDKPTGNTHYLRPGAFIHNGDVGHRIFAHPDMLKQYTTCLSELITEDEEFGVSQPQVYFDVWKSLNGRFQQRMINPSVDLVSAPWSVTEDTPWMLPLLVDLSPWRTTHKRIREINNQYHNYSDIIFVADFPNMSLDNYISPSITANITVLSGAVEVEIESKNISVGVNETLTVPENTTHKVHTVSASPSCYMYVYFNQTHQNLTQEQLIGSDPELQKYKEKRDAWKNKTMVQKLGSFYARKFYKYQLSVWQLYYVIRNLLEFDVNKHEVKRSHGSPMDEL